MIKKGIILAGGMGTRMSPLTKSVNKQLLPIYDKPLIYYPLSILMLAKIRDILIIVNKGQLNQYKKLFPEKKNLGINITFKEQDKPRGLPDAFILGEKFINNSNTAMILGDNFFYGQNLSKLLTECARLKHGAKIVLHSVKNPHLFGVAKINDKNKNILKIIEKPKKFISNYKKTKKLSAEFIGRGGAWLDTGSISDYYKTSAFVQAVENRQGFKIACLEEIALLNKWINKKDVKDAISFYGNCEYSSYLKKLI